MIKIGKTGRQEDNMKAIEEYVRSIPDFPEPGIPINICTIGINDLQSRNYKC